MTEANSTNVSELFLYATNEGALYTRSTIPAINNMARKKAKGQFDQEKAVKAFYHVADKAARMYGREFSTGERDGLQMFSTADRWAVAAQLLDYYTEEINENA